MLHFECYNVTFCASFLLSIFDEKNDSVVIIIAVLMGSSR